MKTEKKLFALEIAVCAAFILTILISCVYKTDKSCKDIKENVLRLHVIANSDSSEDQSVKLLVRDAILSAGSRLFDGTVRAEDAVRISQSEEKYLTETAKKVLTDNGFGYSVKVETGKSRFPTRVYDDVTLPAGEYTAVRVILGEGKGHNWWCVMFPPMCLGAAESKAQLSDVLSDDALALVTSGKKYEVRFKIIEWYENIKMTLERKTSEE